MNWKQRIASFGSRGVVIPHVQRPIELGGPVTVTDRDIGRYFMTIPEASGLAIQGCGAGIQPERGVLRRPLAVGGKR